MTEQRDTQSIGVVLALAALAFIAAVAVLGGALLAFRALAPMATYSVASSSMEPTLRKRQVVLVEGARALCPHLQLERGEVVLIRRPGRPPMMHRVVALPGDEVATRGGLAVVNGRLLATGAGQPGDAHGLLGDEQEQWLRGEAAGGRRWRVAVDGAAEIPDTPPRRLGADEVFELGDNRAAALDSRMLGPASLTQVCGRAISVVGGAQL